MDARSLIETLKGRGLSLYLEGERIKVEAPQEPDPETKALVEELKRCREEVKLILAQEEGETEPQPTTIEALTVSLLAEIGPDEVDEILRVWKKLFRMDLDPVGVLSHLRALRAWQSRWEELRNG